MNADWTHRNGLDGRRGWSTRRCGRCRSWSGRSTSAPATPSGARLLAGPIVAGGLVYAMDADGAADRGDPRRAARLDGAAWCRRPAVRDSGPGGGMTVAGRRALRHHRLRRGAWRSIRRAAASLWRRTLDGAGALGADGGRRAGCSSCRATTMPTALDAAERRHALAGAGHRRGRAARRREPGGRPASSRCCPSPRARCWASWRATGSTVWSTAVTGGRRDVRPQRITDISGDPVHRRRGSVYASNQSGRTVRLDAADRRAGLDASRRAPTGRPGRSAARSSSSPTSAPLVRADAATGELLWQVQLPELFPHRGLVRPRQALRGDRLLRTDPRRRPALGRGRRRPAARLRAAGRDGAGAGAAARRRRRAAGGGRRGDVRRSTRDGTASGFPMTPLSR